MTVPHRRLPLVVNICIMLSAIVAIICLELDYKMAYMILKPITTILVICIPIAFGRVSAPRFLMSMMAGLVFCLMGDTFLLFDSLFIFGLGSFLIGHLLFIYGFYTLGGFHMDWRPVIPLTLLCTGLVYYMDDQGAMQIPIVAYMMIISVMAWQGISKYLCRPNVATRLIAWGSALFVISDAILAINRFASPLEYSGVFVLTTYWIAVTLIANATIHVPDDMAQSQEPLATAA